MKIVLFGLVLLVSMSTWSAPAHAQEIKGVWVTRRGGVDTSTPKSIIKDLVKEGMTDEQKALAIFNWYRRVIYPHRYLAGDRREVLRQVNSYGNTLCGSHAANMGWLMREAGFKTRCVYISGGGHTFLDVWFDDAWHSLDPETDFAVWSRGDKPHLINMDELKADPTLLDNAEAEKRARPWLFKAMKFPWAERKVMADYCDNPKTKCDKMGMQWSSSVIKGQTIKEYFVEGVKTVGYSKDNEANGGHIVDPDLMKLVLKPHEKLVRRWSNEGKGRYIFGEGFNGYPAHLLYGGGADENDEEVFKYVEPYRKDGYGIPELPVDRCYRYSGNGHLLWSPDIPAGELAAAPGVKLDNIMLDAKTGLLRQAEVGKPGTIEIPIRSSYALVCAAVRGTWIRAGDGDLAALSIKAGKEWKEVWKNDKTGEAELEAAFDKPINGKFGYTLRIELAAKANPGDVALKRLSLDHTHVNNWLVLPQLEPGKNVIGVRLDNPDVLQKLNLWVQFSWDEGEGWKDARELKKQVTGSPFEFEVEAQGPRFPRMKELVLWAEPK